MRRRKESRVVWRAGSDRIEHGHFPRQTRTLCGKFVVAEALARPAELRKRCPVCLELTGAAPALGL